MRRPVVLAVAVALAGGAACAPPSSSAPCEPSCATRPPACDDGCPTIADELCVDGGCVRRGEDVVDVVVDVNVDRDLVGVAALLLAVVDARVAACDDLSSVADVDAALAGNRFEVSGGSFHPDLPGGLVPAGDVVVVVDAVDEEGQVVGHGCTPAAAGAAGAGAGADVVDVLVAVEAVSQP
jgi:hypothetical protein